MHGDLRLVFALQQAAEPIVRLRGNIAALIETNR
jgi:hypothetical protein